MTTVPPSSSETSAPKAPPSPARLLIWSAAWAVVAILGFAVLIPNWQRVVDFDLYGQRSVGIVFFTPVVALILALLLTVRAIRWIGPSRDHRSRWSAEQRVRAADEQLAGQPSTPFIVFAAVVAIIWLAGVVVVGFFFSSLVQRPDSLALALMLLALVAMAWVSVLQAGLRRRAAASRAAS